MKKQSTRLYNKILKALIKKNLEENLDDVKVRFINNADKLAMRVNFNGIPSEWTLTDYPRGFNLYSQEKIWDDIKAFYVLGQKSTAYFFESNEIENISALDLNYLSFQDEALKKIHTPYWYHHEVLEDYYDMGYPIFQEEIIKKTQGIFAVNHYKGKVFYVTPTTRYLRLWHIPHDDLFEFLESFRKDMRLIMGCGWTYQKAFDEVFESNIELEEFDYEAFFALPASVELLSNQQKAVLNDLTSFIEMENYGLNCEGASRTLADNLSSILSLDDDDLFELRDYLLSCAPNFFPSAKVWCLSDGLLKMFLKENIAYDKNQKSFVIFIKDGHKRKILKSFSLQYIVDIIKEYNSRLHIRNLNQFQGNMDFVFEIELRHSIFLDTAKGEHIYHFKFTDIFEGLEHAYCDRRQEFEDRIYHFCSCLFRRENNKIDMDNLQPYLSRFYVSREDSYKAGNCLEGTRGWISQNGLEDEKEIRADMLFRLDGDNLFVKRAIASAFLRNKDSLLSMQ